MSINSLIESPFEAMTSSSSTSSESIPLADMRNSALNEEERQGLLHEAPLDIEEGGLTNEKEGGTWYIGAIFQIALFTIIGLLIALASGAFVYLVRHRLP